MLAFPAHISQAYVQPMALVHLQLFLDRGIDTFADLKFSKELPPSSLSSPAGM
jgi:hypothetical protein